MTNRQNESTSGRQISPRLFKTTQEISLTSTTLGIVGTSKKGPAFVPQTFLTFNKDDNTQGVLNTYENVFGTISELQDFNISQLSAYEWFNQGGEQLTFTRVLGIGNNGQENDEGIVEGSGFIVGQEVVSGSTNLGKIDENSFSTSGGPLGRTTFICERRENNQFVSEGGTNRMSSFNDYLQQIGEEDNITSKYLISDVIFCPSGSQVLLESSDATPTDIATIRNELPDVNFTNIKADNVTSITNPRIFIKGLKNEQYNILTSISSSPDVRFIKKSLFNESELNRDADYILHKGHLVYSSFYHEKGTVKFSDGKHFAVVYGNTDDGDIIYEDFQSIYKTASTPWIVSQPIDRLGLDNSRVDMHKKCIKLFRFHALDDGDIGNRFRIRITPQKLGSKLKETWSRFAVKVWEYDEKTDEFAELFEYRDLNLDPESPDYIGFVFGTKHEYYNVSTQKVVTEGQYESRNNYLRVEINDDVEWLMKDNYYLMPSGFMPYPRINTSSLPNQTVGGEEIGIVQKPISYIDNLLYKSSLNSSTPNINTFDSVGLDEFVYWGVLFNRTKPLILEGTPVNDSVFSYRVRANVDNQSRTSRNYKDYTKYFQNNYNNQSLNSWTYDLVDNDVDTTNSFFHLEKIMINSEIESDNLEGFWKYAMYRRDGKAVNEIDSLGTANAVYKYIEINSYLSGDSESDSVHSDFLSFDLFTFGGFDGVNILDRDKKLMNQSAFVREIEDEKGISSSNGPTVFAYELGHNLIVDDSNCEPDMIVFPAVGHNTFNKKVSVSAGQNKRYLSVLNVAEYDSTGIILDSNFHVIDPTDPNPETRTSLVADINSRLSSGISSSISSVASEYYNNKYTINICNSLEGVITSSNFTDKLVTVLPAYQFILSSSASLNRPLDSIFSFSDSILQITKVINSSFTDSSNNNYASVIKQSIDSSVNLNYVISYTNNFKLSSANTSIRDRNSLSRFAHNTRILIDIKKKIKYAIYTSNILFNNNSRIDNINVKLNNILTQTLQPYVNNNIIQNFYVTNNTGLSRLEKSDMLSGILRTKIVISLFGKREEFLEEIRLADILNIVQNNLTQTAGVSIIKPTI